MTDDCAPGARAVQPCPSDVRALPRRNGVPSMRVFVQGPLAFLIFSFGAGLSGRALAQADSPPAPTPSATLSAESVEEVTVRGQKTMTQYRLEIEQARDEVFRLYNEANEGKDNDITCGDEQPTGS